MSGSGIPAATSWTKASWLVGREAREVVAQDDRPQVGLERLAGLEPPRFVGQPAFDVDVARGIEPADGRERRLEVDAAEPAVADPCEDPLDRGDVADPTALGDQQPARPRDRGEVAEERVVVGHPVERRGRQDRIHLALDRQRRAEVGDDVFDPVAEPREPLAARLDHRRRAVERDDAAIRQALGQHLGHAAAAATGVEDPLVAVERQPVEDDRPPARHRGRRRGRRSGRPSRAASDGQPPAVGRFGGAGGADGRRCGGRPARLAQPVPRHDRADRRAARRTPTSPAGTPRSTPGSRRRTCSAVAPAPGGLSGWNVRRMAPSVVSRPVDAASAA